MLERAPFSFRLLRQLSFLSLARMARGPRSEAFVRKHGEGTVSIPVIRYGSGGATSITLSQQVRVAPLRAIDESDTLSHWPFRRNSDTSLFSYMMASAAS